MNLKYKDRNYSHTQVFGVIKKIISDGWDIDIRASDSDHKQKPVWWLVELSHAKGEAHDITGQGYSLAEALKECLEKMKRR